MSKAQSTQGSKLYVSTGVADTFVRISEITSVGNITGDSVSDIDVTNLDSEGYKEYIAGLKEPPSADYEANYVSDDEGQIRIQELFESGETVDFKFEAGKSLTPTGKPLTVIRKAYVSQCGFGTEVDNAMKLNFSLRFSGKPDIEEAS